MEEILVVVLDVSYSNGVVPSKDAAGGIWMASIFPLDVFELRSHSISIRYIHDPSANSARSEDIFYADFVRSTFFQFCFQDFLQCLFDSWACYSLYC